MLSKRGAEATRATKGTSFVVPPPRQTPPAGGRGGGWDSEQVGGAWPASGKDEAARPRRWT